MDKLQQSVMDEMLKKAATRYVRQLTRDTIERIVGSGYERLRVLRRPAANSVDVHLVEANDRNLIDDQIVQKFGVELQFLVKTNPGGNFLLSLEKVGAISSDALAKLIRAHKTVKSLKGKLIFSSVKPDLYEIFVTTRLDRFFNIEENEAAAMAAFSTPSVTDA